MTQVLINRTQFPTLIRAATGAGRTRLSECLDRKDELRDELLRSGALLLRGFAAPGILKFADFCTGFSDAPLSNYRGGASPRRRIVDGVYTSTEYLPSLDLSLHNEMCYTHRWPTHLFFMCIDAPKIGGETPIADSRALLRRIDPDIVAEFSEKQILYTRRLSADPADLCSWPASFETDDPLSVEEYCLKGNIRFRWKTDDGLELAEIRPSSVTHAITSERSWFNQAAAFHSDGKNDARLDAFFGDGSPISKTMLNVIREAMISETVLFKWQPGDVLILDNVLTAHGRRPFGGARKIVLAMT